MQRTLTVTTAAVVLAMAAGLPASAGPDDGADVAVSPGSVSVGEAFSVTVSGCASGDQLQVQVDPAGVVATASCDGTPGFASAQFLAGGPLAQTATYEVVVQGPAGELGRASVEVVAGPETSVDKRTAKAELSATEAPPVPADPAAETEERADPAAAPEDPAAEPEDPAAEPEARVDQAAAPEEPPAAPEDRAAAPDPPPAATVDDRPSDADLADTGPAASGPIAITATLTLIAGLGLLTLARRRRSA
jgi:hypothetical protein